MCYQINILINHISRQIDTLTAKYIQYPMGLLPDMQNCSLHMHPEWQKHFTYYRLQRKSLVHDPGIHHSISIMHPWCMLGLLTHGVRENIPRISGTCITLNFMYLARGSFSGKHTKMQQRTTRMDNISSNITWFVISYCGTFLQYIKCYA